jgi:hypothetical protein
MTGIKPELAVGLMVADGVYRDHGALMTVTAVCDSAHSPGSLHYVGLAADLRIRDIPPETVAKIRERLAAALGPDFDVLLEADHIHVEFQPKVPLCQ